MLIIEGSDCLGKTTIVKKMQRLVTLWDQYPVATSHMSRPNGSFDFFTGYRPFISPYVIQDRFHLGSLAYHDGEMTRDHLRIVEGWIRAAGGTIVLLHCSDEDDYRRRIEADERGNILPIDKMCQANSRFNKMVEDVAGPWIDYEFDVVSKYYVEDGDIEDIVKVWIERRKEAIKAWNS